jgi:peptidoglycan-associated lipoprotein
MPLSARWLPIATAAALLAACGGKPEPEQPAPAPAAEAAPPPAEAQPAPPPPAPAPAEKAPAEDPAAVAARNTSTALEQLAAVIHFDFDKSDIRPDDQPNLARKVVILRANASVRLRISGHADERGSDEYNLALGNRRALAAKQQLVNQGVEADRIETVSFGEERPVDPGHNEAAWFQNRRDEFEVTARPPTLNLP